MRNQNIDQCWQFQHGLYDEFPDAEKQNPFVSESAA